MSVNTLLSEMGTRKLRSPDDLAIVGYDSLAVYIKAIPNMTLFPNKISYPPNELLPVL